MKKKIPFWPKTGLIFSAAVLLIEILYSNLESLIFLGFHRFFLMIFYLAAVIEFPLQLLGQISNELVLKFVDIWQPPYIYPNLLGVLLVVVVWFGIGAGLGKLYEKYLKNKGD